MRSPLQVTAIAILFALAACTERGRATGKAPEHIPRERNELAATPPRKPSLEDAYERREADQLLRGDAVDKAKPIETRIGVAGTHLFHRPDCKAMKDVPTSEQIRFTSPYDAVDAGYTPCQSCDAMH
jgi:hypothetical protein